MIVLAAPASVRSNEVSLEEATAAYKSGPFAFLSQDYFARFSQDQNAKVEAGEMKISRKPAPFQPFLVRRAQVDAHRNLATGTNFNHVFRPATGLSPTQSADRSIPAQTNSILPVADFWDLL